MPPRTQFSKDDIVETAFQLAAEDGLDAITARKVAERLGSSVAPIYHNFKDIEDLKRAVISKVITISRAMMQKRYTDSRFLDIGVASLRFAREYGAIFRDLVLRENPYMKQYEQELAEAIDGNVISEMKSDPSLAGLSEEELNEVLLKLRIFQGGLSMMVANELLPESIDEAAQIELLRSTGEDVVAGIFHRRAARADSPR